MNYCMLEHLLFDNEQSKVLVLFSEQQEIFLTFQVSKAFKFHLIFNRCQVESLLYFLRSLCIDDLAQRWLSRDYNVSIREMFNKTQNFIHVFQQVFNGRAIL